MALDDIRVHHFFGESVEAPDTELLSDWFDILIQAGPSLVFTKEEELDVVWDHHTWTVRVLIR